MTHFRLASAAASIHVEFTSPRTSDLTFQERHGTAQWERRRGLITDWTINQDRPSHNHPGTDVIEFYFETRARTRTLEGAN